MNYSESVIVYFLFSLCMWGMTSCTQNRILIENETISYSCTVLKKNQKGLAIKIKKENISNDTIFTYGFTSRKRFWFTRKYNDYNLGKVRDSIYDFLVHHKSLLEDSIFISHPSKRFVGLAPGEKYRVKIIFSDTSQVDGFYLWDRYGKDSNMNYEGRGEFVRGTPKKTEIIEIDLTKQRGTTPNIRIISRPPD